jgi:ketosteroid isomerase-like protein
MQVNDPNIVREVTAAVAAYDVALTSNDVARLGEMFIDNAEVVRYGPHENLYGAAEIAAFRASRRPGPRPRSVERTIVTTYGQDFAVAHVEYRTLGNPALGRQSQAWARIDGQWRIVGAHVSYLEERPG